MERVATDVDGFIAGLPDDVRPDIEALDRVISAAMDGLERVLWTGKMWGGTDQQIIGYGTITNTRSDKRTVEWFLVGLARQKRHLSIYVSAVEDRQYLAERDGPALGNVKVGKSNITFRSVDDIDLAKLAALVRKARAVQAAG